MKSHNRDIHDRIHDAKVFDISKSKSLISYKVYYKRICWIRRVWQRLSVLFLRKIVILKDESDPSGSSSKNKNM